MAKSAKAAAVQSPGKPHSSTSGRKKGQRVSRCVGKPRTASAESETDVRKIRQKCGCLPSDLEGKLQALNSGNVRQSSAEHVYQFLPRPIQSSSKMRQEGRRAKGVSSSCAHIGRKCTQYCAVRYGGCVDNIDNVSECVEASRSTQAVEIQLGAPPSDLGVEDLEMRSLWRSCLHTIPGNSTGIVGRDSKSKSFCDVQVHVCGTQTGESTSYSTFLSQRCSKVLGRNGIPYGRDRACDGHYATRHDCWSGSSTIRGSDSFPEGREVTTAHVAMFRSTDSENLEPNCCRSEKTVLIRPIPCPYPLWECPNHILKALCEDDEPVYFAVSMFSSDFASRIGIYDSEFDWKAPNRKPIPCQLPLASVCHTRIDLKYILQIDASLEL